MNYTLLSTRLSRGISGVAVAGAGAGLYYTYMRSVVHADSGASKRAFGSGPAFLSLELESTETVNHNTKRLRFKLPEPDSISGLTLTSALLTFSWPKGSTFPVLRPYTPVNSLDEPGAIELLVKRYPTGKQSTHIHSLQPGDSLRFVTCLPGYNWQPNKHSEIMLIAGGAGITPAYQLIRGILQNPDDHTKITLVFGVNTDADLLLRKEFDDYKTRFPSRFQAVYTVSQPVDGSPFRKGYVSKDLLKEISPSAEDCKIFVCGPPPMEESLVGSKRKPGILEELGYRKDQIHRF
ncbi:ferredoxin reductase-like protein [Annulohypoxylon truncatum]|uniref:ferredoxin reductase-like protein n=1 Tax=Annulohypoxylon truncatum TaxID=327061 RepID=UPI002007C0FE|nr:ferredoxin reductase-like protein [Annulohypoxylon truncatum]KAI1209805.1 ferredoxin reductase-like protein [Annulohypoxylon truncatum]